MAPFFGFVNENPAVAPAIQTGQGNGTAMQTGPGLGPLNLTIAWASTGVAAEIEVEKRGVLRAALDRAARTLASKMADSVLL